MKIVIAPDSFKESLTAREACDAIARGVRRVLPDAQIDAIPMADGGEGTVDALIAATGGRLAQTTVHGPLGEPIVASWGVLGDESRRVAVIEMAAASGLALVPTERRNPLSTTTFGTGELIAAALDAGLSRIIIGIGGSATVDGGAGAAQAIGVRFLDRSGQTLPPGLSGGGLADVAHIDISPRDPRLASIKIEVACDVTNPLCGPSGAAAVFGPQKGATPEQVAILDRNLSHLAEIIRRDLGKDVKDMPGAGAAGGLGAGLVAFFDATIRRGVDLVMDAVRFSERIVGADLIITGEGRIDAQSMMGKVIAGVGNAGKAAGIPVIAMVGSIGPGAEQTLEILDGYHAISPPGTPSAESIARAAEFLESTAASLLKNRFAS